MDYQTTIGQNTQNYSVNMQINPAQASYNKPSVSEQMGFRKTRAS